MDLLKVTSNLQRNLKGLTKDQKLKVLLFITDCIQSAPEEEFELTPEVAPTAE